MDTHESLDRLYKKFEEAEKNFNAMPQKERDRCGSIVAPNHLRVAASSSSKPGVQLLKEITSPRIIDLA